MLIVLSTLGTTGDVVPYVALGQALARRGHAVLLCSHPHHRAFVEAHGIAFDAVGAPLPPAELAALFDACATESTLFGQVRRLTEGLFLRRIDRQIADQRRAQAVADVVVASHFDYAAQQVAARAGRPWVSVSYTPHMLARSPHLNLWTVSPAIAGETPGFDGYWFLDAPPGCLPSDLQAFLVRHPRPIVATLGSMVGLRGGAVMAYLYGALTQIDVPVVVQGDFPARPGWFVLRGYVPYEHLFPHAGVVVHHGGAGTTAHACRAGVPSVVVPQLFDQPYWAGRLAALGVAPGKGALATQITDAMTDGGMQVRASLLGRAIRAEHGVDAAVEQIERLTGETHAVA